MKHTFLSILCDMQGCVMEGIWIPVVLLIDEDGKKVDEAFPVFDGSTPYHYCSEHKRELIGIPMPVETMAFMAKHFSNRGNDMKHKEFRLEFKRDEGFISTGLANEEYRN